MAINKTPGVDGLPVEFYIQNWEIISDDILNLYSTILNTICNMELRDVIYYGNETNLNLAVLNLDWYKAFDLVPVDFVFKALLQLGFGNTFVNMIKTLYTNIEGTLEINNIVSDIFPIDLTSSTISKYNE